MPSPLFCLSNVGARMKQHQNWSQLKYHIVDECSSCSARMCRLYIERLPCGTPALIVNRFEHSEFTNCLPIDGILKVYNIPLEENIIIEILKSKPSCHTLPNAWFHKSITLLNCGTLLTKSKLVVSLDNIRLGEYVLL